MPMQAPTSLPVPFPHPRTPATPLPGLRAHWEPPGDVPNPGPPVEIPPDLPEEIPSEEPPLEEPPGPEEVPHPPPETE